MKNKDKGSRIEREVKNKLEKEGFLCCKSGSSLGIYDIIAITPNVVRLIQVKSTKTKFYWSTYLKEIKTLELTAEMLPYCCRQELWVKEKRKWLIFSYNSNLKEWERIN